MIENMTDESIYEVYRRAVDHFEDGSAFVEVGCYYGNSVIFLAEEIRKAGKKIKVYAVDTWRYKEGANGEVDIYPEFLINIQEYRDIIKHVRRNSVYAAQGFLKNSISFVFIDANHEFESVLMDILIWKRVVKRGGWIGGHDYNDDGVRRAVDTVFGFLERDVDDEDVEVIKTDSWLVKL